MTWLDSAAALLAAAETATLSAPVERAYISPGPRFARDCRQLVVTFGTVDASPLPEGEVPGGSCAVVPSVTFTVWFHADCYPAANDQGKPPPEAQVTAWTEDFVADAEAIWDAIADAALAGTLGECGGVTIGQTAVVGPAGGGAEFSVPVRLLSL